MLLVFSTDAPLPLQLLGVALFLLQILLPDLLYRFNQKLYLAIVAAVVAIAVVSIALYKVWNANNNNPIPIWQRWWREGARAGWREWTRRDLWPYYAAVGVVGLVSVCCLSVGLMVWFSWLPFLAQVVTMLTVIGFGRAVAGPDNFFYPSMREAKLEELTALVREMPLEPYVADEDLASVVSIGQLKQMLQRRGVAPAELNSFLDRQNLAEEIRKRRQYSDTCCICFENFVQNDPIRVLPKCRHELHVECLDKWVYTFANGSKVRQDPTCPLCKTGLK